jgi:serine/threonine protein kinase
LIGADGYIKLTDFGLSKNGIVGDAERFSVCGTPEYLAPEVIKKEGHGKAVDWWCLGSLIYELIHGLPPFYSSNRNDLFERIKHEDPKMSKDWSVSLKSLLGKLLTKDANERMKNIATIKEHPWFIGINWNGLLRKEISPLFVPLIHGEADVSHFDKQFTKGSIESQNSSYSDSKVFEGFSFEHKKSPTSVLEVDNNSFDMDKSESDGDITFSSEDEYSPPSK